MMRTTFGTTATISAIVLLASAFWPDGRPGPSPRRIIAQDEPQAAATRVPLFSPTLGEADLRAEARLQKRIDVDYLELPFAEALEHLGITSELQFYVKRRHLEDLEIDMDVPVSMSLKDVSAETALELMLENLYLTYVIRDGVVLITTDDDFDSVAEVRVYNCRDLLEAHVGQEVDGDDSKGGQSIGSDSAPVPSIENKKKNDRSTKKQKTDKRAPGKEQSRGASVTADVLGQFGGGMGGGGGGMVVPQGLPVREERLMNIITIAVMPESWEDVGGPGTIGEFDGMIVIRHNPRAHRQVERVLHMLRDASGQQDWEDSDSRRGFPIQGGGGGFF